MRVYLAAPFFNAAEVAMVERLEEWLSEHEVFSPRLQTANTEGKDLSDPAVRAEIFDINVKHLQLADVVVAWLDRAFPADSRLVLRGNGGEREVQPQSDLGTVWEMGYASSQAISVIGFTESERLNVMIAEGCEAIVRSEPELRAAVYHLGFYGTLDDFQPPWQGEAE